MANLDQLTTRLGAPPCRGEQDWEQDEHQQGLGQGVHGQAELHRWQQVQPTVGYDHWGYHPTLGYWQYATNHRAKVSHAGKQRLVWSVTVLVSTIITLQQQLEPSGWNCFLERNVLCWTASWTIARCTSTAGTVVRTARGRKRHNSTLAKRGDQNKQQEQQQ